MTSSQPVSNTFFGLDISPLSNYSLNFKKWLSRRHLLIEFSDSKINIAEVRLNSDSSIEVTYIRTVRLPEDSIERGIPVDQEAMSAFISDILIEANIYSNKVFIIIETKYIRLVFRTGQVYCLNVSLEKQKLKVGKIIQTAR